MFLHLFYVREFRRAGNGLVEGREVAVTNFVKKISQRRFLDYVVESLLSRRLRSQTRALRCEIYIK